MTETWHGPRPKNDLAAVPRGVQTFAGVAFDVRGLIQVGRQSQSGEEYPKRVDGILVGRKCTRLHFLHAAIDANSVTNGTQIGGYVIHWAGGQAHEIAIVAGQDVKDWWKDPSEPDSQLIVAWEGTNGDSQQNGRTIRLFMRTWENLSPDVAVQSIDFFSRDLFAAPFLVAIPVEGPPDGKSGLGGSSSNH